MNKTEKKRFKHLYGMVILAILSLPYLFFQRSPGMPAPDGVPSFPASKAAGAACVAAKPESPAWWQTPPSCGGNNVFLFGTFIGQDSGCNPRRIEVFVPGSSLPIHGKGRPDPSDTLLSMVAKDFRKASLSGYKNLFLETFEDGHYRRGA
jgi:hypothetical protein